MSACFLNPNFIKSKRIKYEFALLVQETMLRHGIILNSLVQSEANDSATLEEIIEDIEDTFKISLDLQIMYGERKKLQGNLRCTKIRNTRA